MDKDKTLLVFVTLSRILFTVGIIVYYERVAIVVLFMILALLSDYLDGKIARKYGISSSWGGALDGLVDKVCILLLVVTFFSLRDISYLYFPLIFIREVLQVVGYSIKKLRKKVDYQANWPSKITTNLQAIALAGLVFNYVGLFYVILPLVAFFGTYNVYQYWKVLR
jgi:CDP-diacylglycerol--glycerol-3-phosphate 3-phosphatidyltransferase